MVRLRRHTSQIVEKPYDPTPARENVRGLIAQALVWTLVGVIAAVVLTGLVTIYGCRAKDSCSPETIDLKTIKAVIDLVLTPLIGLVGAVTAALFWREIGIRQSGLSDQPRRNNSVANPAMF